MVQRLRRTDYPHSIFFTLLNWNGFINKFLVKWRISKSRYDFQTVNNKIVEQLISGTKICHLIADWFD